MRIPLVVVMASATAIVAATSARAQEPYEPKRIPAGEEAPTKQQHLLDNAALWTESLQAEVRLPEDAPKEVEDLADELVSIYGHVLGTWFFAPAMQSRAVAIIERLHEQPFSDPVLQLVSGDLLSYLGRLEEAGSLIEQAKARLPGRRSPLLQYRLALSLSEFHARSGNRGARTRAAERALERAIELAASPDMKGKERFCLGIVLHALGGEIGADDSEILASLERSVGEPNYVTLVLRGQHHQARAWAARGTGWSSTVSDNAYRTVGEELEDAMRALVEAHTLCPQYPEAPGTMVGVMGLAGAEQGEIRRWFDLAVAAQFDYEVAYSSYLNYAQPRWGGSLRLLQAFGEECLETARFDTAVPNNYRVAISHMVRDGADPEIWVDEDVRRNLARINEGTLEASKSYSLRHYISSCKVIDLVLAEEMTAAAALARSMDYQLSDNALRAYRVEMDWLETVLRPFDQGYEPSRIARTDLFAGFDSADDPGAEAAMPLASRADAVSFERWRSGYPAWLAQTFVEAYDEIGGAETGDDDPARSLLRDIEKILFGPRPADAEERARALLDADCNDPLVLYAIVRTLDDGTNDVQNVVRLRKLLPDLESRYPPLFAFWALGHLRTLAERADRSDIASALIPEVREKLLAATTHSSFAGEGAHYFALELYGAVDLVARHLNWVNDEMVEQLKGISDVDPWLRDLMIGLHHARRGVHLADTERARRRDLGIAAQHLERAHARRPESPEAAAAMTLVSAMLDDPDAASPREWFDRAVAHVIDYQAAYAGFSEALRPAHGGSVQAMYGFGVECLESDRFDLDIPIWFVRCLSKIQDEVAVPREVWAAEGVEPRLDHLFEGLERARSRLGEDALADLDHGRCVLAWAAGRYTDALKAWQRAGRTLGTSWIEIVDGADVDLIRLDLERIEAAKRK